jgi:hypothetical protein
MKKLLFIAAFSFALSACGGIGNEKLKISDVVLTPPPSVSQLRAEDKAGGQAMEAESFADAAAKPAPANQSEIEKKIIKEGEISFETDNVNDTRKAILSALKNAGGYISEDNENVNGADNQKQYVLNIRVPAKNFDTFLGSVTASATRIDNKNIRMRDITTEYIDTKARLDNKKLLEQRYLALLKQAAKMSDMLEIENKLSEIRSDIESTQGQLNYMDKQVSYSSLSITFYTKQAEQVNAGNGFGYKFKQAVSGGLNFLQGLFFGIVALWPLWVVVLAITLFVMARTKGRNKKAAGN